MPSEKFDFSPNPKLPRLRKCATKSVGSAKPAAHLSCVRPRFGTMAQTCYDWVKIARLGQHEPTAAAMGDTNTLSYDTSKLSDADINAIGFTMLRFDPVGAGTASKPTVYFDFSNLTYDCTQRARRPETCMCCVLLSVRGCHHTYVYTCGNHSMCTCAAAL